jgi:hypothetical protein
LCEFPSDGSARVMQRGSRGRGALAAAKTPASVASRRPSQPGGP